MTGRTEGAAMMLKECSVEHLFSMEAELNGPLDAGPGPLGRRTLNSISAGWFKGARLRGELQPGTGDWMLTRQDGVMVVDARVVLRADDGAIIHMSYGGRIIIPSEVVDEARDPNRRHLVDPTKYYFRTTPLFETGASAHAWLNDLVGIGFGRLLQGRRVGYEVYKLL